MKRFLFSIFLILLFCGFNFAQDSLLKIIETPKPELPKDYGTLDAQGSIFLRIEFLADGKVGEIKIVYSMVKPLTDLAIEAAKKIKFAPAIKDGQAVTMSKIVQYSYSWETGWRIPPEVPAQISNDQDESLQITKEDLPTKDASGENPDGVVILRVTFLASGKIGAISIVSGLSDELNNQALAAAKNIKFQPAKKNGVAYSVTKQVEYSFTIFYKEDDANLLKKAEITQMPAPAHPKGKAFQGVSGKVRLTLNLFANGKIEVAEIKSDLPKEFQEKSIEAVSKIKFNPAIYKNGNPVTQIKDIEYEFKSKN